MTFYIFARDVISDVKSAPETFTSWDKCMQKSYCKWPAIVGIVVGSLILLSIIWCFARCLCCGAELCACCCNCCRPRRSRDRPSQYKDEYSRVPPTPYGGYQPTPAPMAYGHPSAPQFATFDDPSGKKINEDSLPPMPSWETATKRRVEDINTNGDVEMGRLDTQPQRLRGGYNSVPNGPMSPVSHHPAGGYFNSNDTMHSYHSDLGAQRLGANGTGYAGFQPVPLSPPPTYRSSSNAPSVMSEKFISGAASPTPNEYNHQQHQSYHHQPSSYAPSSVSTRYEPQPDYASSRISMPAPYNPQPEYQARPPSFSQVGRKAISGSYREV
ncbi:hypothetical protein A1O3_01743 [Capronia epimyces CBS 606.96]|uniref:Uncharacterized protein n=1 Tax=Capronia epimyces CBS 606.96 TaxID=1182542 RepID=W9YV91_9EURO|nr:uncharacterized protein A1O3_01743 [Capronia epimyces CBS 606.96]EXJ93186.1 hypothetical protein A1O3_01743 [Capronia epimyces CBS 606.96]